MRRLALASLVGNAVLVVTGGAVRLTGSGLGCPTWPRCTSRSYVTTSEMGGHGIIEFSNRMLTFVVGLLAVACVVAALAQRPRRRSLTRLSVLVLAGIPAQAVLGGITVLTHLNPWVVACHFLASIAVIAAAYALWQRSREGDGPPVRLVPAPLRGLLGTLVAASGAVIVVGAVVTGSGPHAGDAKARRTGLDLVQIAQLHADLVFLLIGLSVAAWFALRAVGAPARAVRAAVVLLGVETAQAAIGFVQYFTHLPILAVGLHMAGACAVWVITLALWYASRERGPAAAGTPLTPQGERSPAVAR
jgi:cytochrome c oxidase assembly protein subunit 15